MRREHSIATTVYNHLFPNPTANDPPDFATHLAKHLVAEVRIETQRFYGGLETVEARYPGLNYFYAPHRKRLGRFPHHARLFRAFDDMGLTEHEISMLCRWEGTLWARQRYERDEGIKVVDTTCAEIGPWVDRRRVYKRGRRSSPRGIKVKTDIEVEIEDVGMGRSLSRDGTRSSTPMPSVSYTRPLHIHSRTVEMTDAESAASVQAGSSTDDSDSEIEGAGIPSNQRLVAAAAQRDFHHSHMLMDRDTPLDPAYEQYLKEQAERGEIVFSGANISSGVRAAALQSAYDNSLSASPSPAPMNNGLQPPPPTTSIQQ
ncbi:hypothetical protein FKW77_004853 [Venturia effusa]|uniref:Uncharacterized protein n=1 Tax=Venturia effusa TaxID=50376 RepID=A0A517L5E6_9PEZI|nr:hypothetical protein FKW77_004853 [Venturia effusa]